MAVKTTGPLSFDTDIVGEFKGSRPHSLSEYYSGGALVPTGTKNAAGNVIPSSGTIKFSDFYGATAKFTPVANNPALYSGAYDVVKLGDGYYAMLLKTSGTLHLPSAATVEAILIGGGGNGGQGGFGPGGGGGGGGVARGNIALASQDYAVTVAGRPGQNGGDDTGQQGRDTTAFGWVAGGGGGGFGQHSQSTSGRASSGGTTNIPGGDGSGRSGQGVSNSISFNGVTYSTGGQSQNGDNGNPTNGQGAENSGDGGRGERCGGCRNGAYGGSGIVILHFI